MTRPLIILDRDGVINHDSPDYIRSPHELRIISGVCEGIAALYQQGFRIVVATNQSGIARGYFSEETLDLMFKKIQIKLQDHGAAIDQFYYCPHSPSAGCNCRKPSPGMLQQALNEFHANPEQTWMIGDSTKDIMAGKTIGCNTCLVRTGNGAATEAAWDKDLAKPPVFDDLQGASNYILNTTAIKPHSALPKPHHTFTSVIRSVFFMLAWALSTIPYSSILVVAMLLNLPLRFRYRIASAWGRASVLMAKYICGINFKIINKQKLNRMSTMYLMNHQSAWETIACISLLPSTAFVVKQELLRVPFFGTGLKSIAPVAINRGMKKTALEQLVQQSRSSVDQGRNILIFPEGTRVGWDSHRRHRRGATYVAKTINVPIQLLSHNSGVHWGNAWWKKTKGTITISCGPLLYPEAGDVYMMSSTWIEQEKQRLLTSD